MNSNNFSRKRYCSVPKLLGAALLFSLVLAGMQFQKQLRLRQPLLFSSSSFDNPHLNYAMMEASALLFRRNFTKPTNNTILVSNMFTKKVNFQGETRKQRNIFFIHVGKTGGTTLRETVLRYGCRLYGSNKARANCFKFLKTHGESALGKRTNGIFHYQQKHPNRKKKINRMDWMFVVREPIARFISSYEYVNPHNCIFGYKERNMDQKCHRQILAKRVPGSFPSRFFYDCFPNIQEFLGFKPPALSSGKKKKTKTKGKRKKEDKREDAGLQDATPDDVDPHRQKCYRLWKGAFVTGLSPDYGHMTANYQFYTKGLKLSAETRNVFVIRTEHLWEDVSRIDTLVGGTGNFSNVQGKIVNQQTTNIHEKNKGLTKSTRNATLVSDASFKQVRLLVPIPFCCALLPDMLTFRSIVNRADNLNEEEKQETHARAWTRCNATSWENLQSKCGASKGKKKGMK